MSMIKVLARSPSRGCISSSGSPVPLRIGSSRSNSWSPESLHLITRSDEAETLMSKTEGIPTAADYLGPAGSSIGSRLQNPYQRTRVKRLSPYARSLLERAADSAAGVSIEGAKSTREFQYQGSRRIHQSQATTLTHH